MPQFCIFESPTPNSNIGRDDVFVRDWSNFDQENFILDYFNIDWNVVFESCGFDPDGSFELFNSKFTQLIDQHLPKVKLTKRQIKSKTKPWITHGIRKSISKRDFYLRKFIKAKDPILKSNFHDSFKSYRNAIVTLCRRSKSNHFTTYFN